MGKYDPVKHKSGRIKDRPTRELKLRQKIKRNEDARLHYLRQRIELGYAPQVRKNVTERIKKLYLNAGLDLAVYFPQEGQPIEDIKREHKKIRNKIRDMLPSDISRVHTNIVVDQVLIGMLPESLLPHLDEEGVRNYCEEYLLAKEVHREHTIQMIPNRIRGRLGGLRGARAKKLKKAMST